MIKVFLSFIMIFLISCSSINSKKNIEKVKKKYLKHKVKKNYVFDEFFKDSESIAKFIHVKCNEKDFNKIDMECRKQLIFMFKNRLDLSYKYPITELVLKMQNSYPMKYTELNKDIFSTLYNIETFYRLSNNDNIDFKIKKELKDLEISEKQRNAEFMNSIKEGFNNNNNNNYNTNTNINCHSNQVGNSVFTNCY